MGDLLIILLLYAVTLTIYMANGRSIAFVDTGPARHLALSLIRDHDLKLNEIRSQLQMLEMTYTVRNVNGNVISSYPVGTAFLAVPFYIVGMLAGIAPDQLDGLSRLEKWSGANLGAILAVLFWLLLRWRTSAKPGLRLILWIAFVFGNANWVVNSQGLWQHIPLEIFEVLALLVFPRDLINSRGTGRLVFCGFFLALSGFMRPTGYVLIPVWGLYVIWKNWRKAVPFGFGVLLGALPQILYNAEYIGKGNAGYFNLIFQGGFFEKTDPVQNFFSLLFSPSRGVLVFSPFLVFLLFWAVPKVRRQVSQGLPAVLVAGSAAAIFFVYLFFQEWWAGWTYGSRFFSDMMPFLVLLLVAPMQCLFGSKSIRRRIAGTIVVSIAIGWSVIVQAAGAWRYDGAWDGRTNLTVCHDVAWDWYDNTIRFCFTAGKNPRAHVNPPNYYQVDPGRIYSMGKRESSQFLWSGFYGQEDWGVWSRTVVPGVLMLHLPDGPGKLYIGAMGTGSPYAPARFRIVLNGHRLRTQLIHPNAFATWQKETLAISLPKKYLTGGTERLEFWARDGIRPWVVGRLYGIALKEMLYVPEGQRDVMTSAVERLKVM